MQWAHPLIAGWSGDTDPRRTWDVAVALVHTYAKILAAGAVAPALNWNGALAFGVDCKKNIFDLFALVSLNFCK